MKKLALLILLIIPVILNAQKRDTLVWGENNIRIVTKKEIKVTGHNEKQIDLKSRNFTMIIRREDYLIKQSKMDEYLTSVMKVMSYTMVDSMLHQSKDFIEKSYCIARKGEEWGVFFLLKEDINGDNLFLGFLSTSFKPSSDHLKLVEDIEVAEEVTNKP